MNAVARPMKGRGYRPDIDGLRAVAVLAVVAFHAFPGWIHGGFIGVDVFFVISGYLITGLIGHELDAGAFSFWRFYARRARRIFPALIVVMLGSLTLGWTMMLPDEFARLGMHVVAGSFFSSNLVLWRESGYFDVSALTKPLLHLWSLGIEEQFYIAWPLCVLALWRVRERRTLVVSAIALASFGYCVLLSYSDLTAAFYSPLSRAWELMVGAALASLLPTHAGPPRASAWREAAVVAGLASIIVSVLVLEVQVRLPGFFTVPLVIGTSLVIAFGADTWVGRNLLASRLPVFVGLISYPLYLWHWPLLVFVRLGLENTGRSVHFIRLAEAASVLFAFAAAAATWHFVERPARRSNVPSRAAMLATLALGVTASLGATAARAPLVRLRGDPTVARAVAARSDWSPNGLGKGVHYTFGVKGEPQVVFIGDSHAELYFPAVQQAARNMASPPLVAFRSMSGCAPVPRIQSTRCDEVYRDAIAAALGGSVRRVIIAAYWRGYVEPAFGRSALGNAAFVNEAGTPASAAFVDSAFRRLAADIARLRRAGKEVVVLLSLPGSDAADPSLLASASRIPFMRDSVAGHLFAASFSLTKFKSDASWIESEVALAAQLGGASLIDPAPYLCPNGTCPTTDERGAVLRSDGSHLRPFASIRYLTFVPSLLAVQSDRP